MFSLLLYIFRRVSRRGWCAFLASVLQLLLPLPATLLPLPLPALPTTTPPPPVPPGTGSCVLNHQDREDSGFQPEGAGVLTFNVQKSKNGYID